MNSSKVAYGYYAVLGIDRNASANEISKAYKKLRAIHHPDKNLTETEKATKKFQELQHAYDTLSDERKKNIYDQTGGIDNGDMPQQSADVNDIFNMMNMNGRGMNGRGMNMNMHMRNQMPAENQTPTIFNIDLKLSEIYNGCKKIVKIPVDDMCEPCAGTGSSTKKRTKCTDCNGNGVRMEHRQIGPGMIQQCATACNKCKQTGYYVNSSTTCKVCLGESIIKSFYEQEIIINNNFDHENVKCIKKKGSFNINTNMKSDIHITFKISNIEDYLLTIDNKYDLLMNHDINMYDALTGYSLFYSEHPDGLKYKCYSDKIIKDGDYKCVFKLGLPNGDNSRGNLIIKFNYIYPESILNNEELHTFFNTKSTKNDEFEYVEMKLSNKPLETKSDNEDNNYDNNNYGEDNPQQNPGCGVQ